MGPVTRFSLNYDPSEDRIVLDAADEAEAATRLWMTRRLCEGVVKALVEMLEKGAAHPESTLQSWEQMAAMQGLDRTPGVKPAADAPGGLVTTVNVRPGNDRFALRFTFGDGEICKIGLTTTELRQTLSVLHGLYAKAGWPSAVWPAWIADPVAETVGSRAN
jgi:hypothetical protein